MVNLAPNLSAYFIWALVAPGKVAFGTQGSHPHPHQTEGRQLGFLSQPDNVKIAGGVLYLHKAVLLLQG